jgi:aspartate/methionine/tyrosine aminotransferase
MFSSRLAFADTTNALSRARERRRTAGLPVVDLIDTSPANAGFEWPVTTLSTMLRQDGIQRQDPDPHGLMVTRQAISDYYNARGTRVPPERLYLSASTSEAYSWIFKLLCNLGEEVLVPEPAYPLLEVLAALEGVVLRPYQMVLMNGEWVIDEKSLTVSRGTRAIVCINPSNPTGAFVGVRDRRVLSNFARKHGLAILCDEVFLDYAAEGVSSPGTWAGESEVGLFVVSGLSKVALAPQLKVGWIVVAGPQDFTKEAGRRLEHIADGFLSVNTPAQLALPDLLRRAEPLRALVRQRVAQNESALKAWSAAAGHRTSVYPRQSGWTAMLALPAGVAEERLLLNALDEGVWAHPGYFYGVSSSSPCVVLSLLTLPDLFKQGLAGLDKALKRA